MKKSAAATETQFSFIKTLQFERNVPKELVETMRNLWSNGKFDENTANTYINLLQAFPVIPEKVQWNLNLVGYHRLGDQIVRVYRSKNDCMYMKELVVDKATGKYQFVVTESKQSRMLDSTTKLNDAEAIEFEKFVKIHNVNVSYEKTV